jgi:hypothetical protein
VQALLPGQHSRTPPRQIKHPLYHRGDRSPWPLCPPFSPLTVWYPDLHPFPLYFRKSFDMRPYSRTSRFQSPPGSHVRLVSYGNNELLSYLRFQIMLSKNGLLPPAGSRLNPELLKKSSVSVSSSRMVTIMKIYIAVPIDTAK